ncbi:hypothetical protein KKA85_08270, partial [bacterium]|nr:hypothetical protein [bacterium]
MTYKSESRIALRFTPEPAKDPAEALRARAVRVLGEANAAALLPIIVDRPEMKLRLFISPW